MRLTGNLLTRQGFLAMISIIIVVGFMFVLHKSDQKESTSLVPVNLLQSALKQAMQSFNTPSIKATNPTELNLLEDFGLKSDSLSATSCTQESMNLDRLQQDHPCVIETIKRHFLHPPATPDVPYSLETPNKTDPSAGQAKGILNYLGNQTEGFFIECGALDGEHLSNTLYMERTLKWSGVLIEADQTSFGKLLSRRRKSYALPVCLSLEPYPTKVTFKVDYAIGSIQENPKLQKKSKKSGKVEEDNLITLQCFPIYSILLAIGQTNVDFFSLDVEGHELRILKTIPWEKVNIKTLAIEWDHVGKQPLIDLMGPNGYYVFGKNEINVGNDLFFARNDSFHVI